jgi:hypothetical protein
MSFSYGNRHHNWTRLIQEYLETHASTLTAKSFCKEKGISYCSFIRYRSNYLKNKGLERPPILRTYQRKIGLEELSNCIRTNPELTIKEVAVKFNASVWSISKACRKIGLSLSTLQKRHLKKKQLIESGELTQIANDIRQLAARHNIPISSMVAWIQEEERKDRIKKRNH